MTASSHKRANSSDYRKTTMRNGVRVVSERIPGVRSTSLGIWVEVGSRCETAAQGGLSHFVEHLVFKGTRNRNAKQIASSLESIGGSLNAFTTREHTCYTARVLDDRLPEAVDILADLTCRPTLTAGNMNRERQVICEEIKESLDNPSDQIHDLFADAYWGGHPLGCPIMGAEKGIRAVPRSRLKKFYDRHYRSGSIVVAAAGSVSHNRLLRLLRENLDLPEGGVAPPENARRPDSAQVKMTPHDSSQTQFCVGFPGLSYDDPGKMALSLMASYLGGGMSSVLFQKIREQRGLVYSVFSFVDFFKDAGVFGVYLGTDQVHLREAYDLIMTECRKLKRRKLSSNTLDTVKAQIKGHITLGMESTSARMHRLGREELLSSRHMSLDDALHAIDQVSISDVLRVANTTFDESRLTLAALGPVDPKLFDDVS